MTQSKWKRRTLQIGIMILCITSAGVIGTSYGLLNYSLTPQTDNRNKALKWHEADSLYPGLRTWHDSLKTLGKWQDTTIVATDGTNFYIASASLVLYQEDGQLVKSGAFVNTYGVNKPDTENPVPKPDGTVNDLVISKTVTGNYGERDKKFIFEITINGAEGEWYNLEGQPAIKKGTAARIELKHGDTVKIYGLTENDTYTIKELEADDYKTTFETKLNGTNKAGGSGNIKTATGTIDAGTSLQTQEVAFTNDRTGSATGFASSYGPYALMVVLAGAVAFVLFRKKRAEY